MIYVRRIVGKSMEPAFCAGDVIIAIKIYKKLVLKRGDIVIARVDNKENIKRISAIEGDSIYILGDNSGHSTDSRTFGPITRGQIYAKYVLKIPLLSRHY